MKFNEKDLLKLSGYLDAIKDQGLERFFQKEQAQCMTNRLTSAATDLRCIANTLKNCRL